MGFDKGHGNHKLQTCLAKAAKESATRERIVYFSNL